MKMKQLLAVLAMSGLLAVGFVGAQNDVSPALRALVDAERAFAEIATHKGIRDSFLEYFAEDAIAFSPAPVSATARLRSRPARPFSELELRWEPRTGDIAASGEFGWLTGPSTFTDHTDPNSKPQPGNYLSVWRRQGDGPWRVFIDVGSQPPQPVTFAPGFTRFAFASRYTGREPKNASVAALREADQALNARIGKAGSGAAYAEVTNSASRLHRNGFLPPIGTAAIRSWMNEHAATMTASTGAVDAARSGDLGYSYGIYDVTGVIPQHGAYVRIWQREASGTWLVVADVTQ
jgi:ketosteroid isomerase-like protein